MNIKETSWSRPVPKPRPKVYTHFKDVEDEEQGVQEKIEYLRKKMVVQRKQEKAFRIENTQLTASTAEDLVQLIRENDRMQASLSDALYAELDTVKNALRTHPLFQMAMTNKGAEEAISWLEDKIFDMAKVVNVLLCKMRSKKRQLQEIEAMVLLMEKFPKPGSSAYEMELSGRIEKVLLEIELALYRRTTAAVLLKKYKEVKDDIEHENVQHEIVLKEMENKLDALLEEEKIMDNILCVAQKFKKQKLKDLADYEKAYSHNYRVRKDQLRKKGKLTEEKLEAEQKSAHLESKRIQAEKLNTALNTERKKISRDTAEKIIRLREKLETYKNKTAKLMDVMRAHNFNEVIDRMKQVVVLQSRLATEAALKSQLIQTLEKQRDNLLLIKCHMKYSGFGQVHEFEDQKTKLEAERTRIGEEIEKIRDKMQDLEESSQEAFLGIFTLSRKLGDRTQAVLPYRQRIKTMFALMEKLKGELGEARDSVAGSGKPLISFLKSVKPIRPEKRLVRVGTPPGSDQESVELDEAAHDAIQDHTVPARAQIKERSDRFLKKMAHKRRVFK